MGRSSYRRENIEFTGSDDRTRTCDPVINSRRVCPVGERWFLMMLCVMGVTAICGSGCGNVHVNYADGRLAVLDVDPAFSQHEWEGIKESELVRQGAHYWDAVGVQFRTAEEMDDPTAVHVQIQRSEVDLGDCAGIQWPGTRTITLYVGPLRREPSSNWTWTAQVAHELGHLIGLSHVDERLAVMAAENAAMGRLQPADLDEFRRVTGH